MAGFIPIDANGPIKVSVILCTKNRSDNLAGALQSVFLAADREPRVKLEAVVVDNGSTDPTQRVLADWQQTSGRRLSVLVEPEPGLCRAKNRGLVHANGEILVFTDDDCRMHPDYFRDLTRHFIQDSELVLRGGRVELGDSTDLRFTTKTEDQTARYAPPAHPGGFVHGCNIAVRRGLFDLIGAFDVRFGPGSLFVAAEDADLIYRSVLAGVPVEYVPDMTVYHFHGRKRLDQVHRLQFQYHFGNGALIAKHWPVSRFLARHLYWNARNGLQEFFGGPKFDPELGLSHWSMVSASVAGLLSYVGHSALGRTATADGRTWQRDPNRPFSSLE